ncbi:MAG: hypothetical protein ACRDYY_13650 [Acidimicrobiales bacterium]
MFPFSAGDGRPLNLVHGAGVRANFLRAPVRNFGAGDIRAVVHCQGVDELHDGGGIRRAFRAPCRRAHFADRRPREAVHRAERGWGLAVKVNG